MSEADRDQLWSRVFATPEGAALLADLAARGKAVIRVSEVEARVARMRALWETGAPKEG